MVWSPAARANSPATALLLLLLSASLSTCGPRQVQPEQTSTETVTPVVARAARAMEQGDYDTAIAGYAEALERTPWNTRLSTALVSAYAARAAHPAQSGRAGLRAAEADLRTALSISPDDPAVRRSLAAILLDLSAREESTERALALRLEARRYAPELESSTPVVQLVVERRLDLAFDLVERGQLDAGIDRLERLHREYPENAETARLLAQARVRKGTVLVGLQDHRNAGAHFDGAVALYEQLGPCDGSRCDAAELRTAHRNRVIAWLSAYRAADARRALDDAERVGLQFPDLLLEVRRLEVTTQ